MDLLRSACHRAIERPPSLLSPHLTSSSSNLFLHHLIIANRALIDAETRGEDHILIPDANDPNMPLIRVEVSNTNPRSAQTPIDGCVGSAAAWGCSCQGFSNMFGASVRGQTLGSASGPERGWWMAHGCRTDPPRHASSGPSSSRRDPASPETEAECTQRVAADCAFANRRSAPPASHLCTTIQTMLECKSK